MAAAAVPECRVAVRVTSVLVAVALALGAGACANGSGSNGSLGGATGTPLSPLPTTADGTSPSTTTGTPSASPTPILPDGRSAMYLTKIDVTGHTITFDLIEFLTGDAARKAWKKAYPTNPGPPDDYFIINDNPKLRTLPVAPGVQFEQFVP